jgi:hypothetical protein
MTVRRGTVLAFLAVSCSVCLGRSTGNQARKEDVDSRIVGTWRGSSVCLVKGSPCRDETDVYRFSKVAGRSGAFSGTGSKVIDGKEILMGRGEWTYDVEKHVLACKTPDIRMEVVGARMEGALKLPDGTAYRQISLKKED